MLNFSNFFGGKRKYVSVVYDNETQHNLRRWAESNGFDLTATFNGGVQPAESFDFHTTIFYSSNRSKLQTGIIEVGQKSVIVDGFKWLGENHDVPVLSVKGNSITNIRKHYEKEGLKDNWPVYIPHVSVSYAKNQPKIKPILPDFVLNFDHIIVKDIIDV